MGRYRGRCGVAQRKNKNLIALTKKLSLISVDIVRAFAAMGVFFYHQQVGYFLAKFTGLQFLSRIDGFGEDYAVPLFFLISGYCIHLSNLKYLNNKQPLLLAHFYKQRFLRLYPPYLFALLLTIGIRYFTYGYVVSGPDFFVHSFAGQGFTVKYFNTINVVLWTISIEVAFYLIYPLFYYIRLKYSLTTAMLVTFLVSALSIAWFTIKGSISLPQFFMVTNLWFAWCWGAYLADVSLPVKTHLKSPVFIIINALIIGLFILLTFLPNKFSIVYFQLKILIWTLPLLCIISSESWLQRHNNFIVKLLGYIGLSSYSLYLLHEPLIVLKNYTAHRFLPASLQFVGLAMGIFLIPVLAWFSFVYVERPFVKRKNNIVAR